MLHEEIRRAWEATVEDPAGRGAGLRELRQAIERHGCAVSPAGADLTIAPPDRAAWRAALGRDAGAPGREVSPAEREDGADLLDALEVDSFGAARSGSLLALLRVSTMLARVGFVDPEATIPVYETFARGWLRGKGSADGESGRPGESDGSRATSMGAWPERPFSATERAAALALLRVPGRLPAGLAPLFWSVVGSEVDQGAITPTIAAFGATYDARLKDACARAILLFEEQAALAREPWPPRVAIESLGHHPPGTLGHAYYHLIVDNGFDPEVLDPDSVTGFHPGIDGTNRRILQQHEIWHLVAGYSTSPLHETAISSFQLAQFGHNYSAIFLATVTTLLTFTAPPFADLMLQVTAEAWRHGRATRPLLPVDWPSYWDRPMGEVRGELGVETFRSVVPDLMAPAG